MNKILITGANGFIGSFLVEEALRRGWEVWAGVRASSNREYLTDPAIRFIDLKYDDPDALRLQVEEHAARWGRWDYVIHNAGITKGAGASDFFRVNYDYTLHLVQALRRGTSTPEKFVYMSSLGAFGPGDETRYTPVRPEDTPKPNTAYGQSKIQSEQFLRSLPDFPYLILRPTGVYGPRERDYYQMVRMVRYGLDLAVGLKPQQLNFIYVKDLVRVCFSALESPCCQKVWFVADGEVYTSRQYSNIVRKALRKKHVLKITLPLAFVKAVSDLAGLLARWTGRPALLNPDKYRILKQRNWTCDISSLRADLGFVPEYNLQRGMVETVDWYRQNGWL